MRLAGALIALLLATIAACSTSGRVLAKALADPLIHSTSAGAALFALLFAAAALLVLGAQPPPTRRPPSPRLALTFIASLAIGNAANTAGHIAVLHALDLPWRIAFYVWNGSDNTYSYLFHSHAGKAATTALLTPLAAPLGLDVGQAWDGLVPPWIGVVVALAFVIALGSGLRLLPAVAAGTGSRWLTLLFGLAALDALKTVIDGGLLTYRCLPALLVAATLALNPDPATLRRRSGSLLAGMLAIVLLYALAWRAVAPEGSRESLASFALVLLSMLVPACGAWRAWAPGTVARTAFAAAAAALAGLWLLETATTLQSLYAPLPRGSVVLDIDPVTLAVARTPAAGRSAARAYADNGDDPLKPRRTLLLGPTPTEPAPRFPLLLLAGRTGPVHTIAAPPWTLEPSRPPRVRADERVVVLSSAPAPLSQAFSLAPFLQQNNYYVLLHGVAAQLRAGGLSGFSIAPLRDARDFDALR